MNGIFFLKKNYFHCIDYVHWSQFIKKIEDTYIFKSIDRFGQVGHVINATTRLPSTIFSHLILLNAVWSCQCLRLVPSGNVINDFRIAKNQVGL